MSTVTSAQVRIPDFDRLAPLYRWMEWFSFGPWLGTARMAFLPDLRGVRSALVLGDGDGRFTARLLRTIPAVRVTAVDCSLAMLRALVSRAGQHAGRVHPQQADVRAWPEMGHAVTGAPFDLIATHFFLDCLTTSEITALARRLRGLATPHATWIVSEFAIPPGPFGRWLARPLVSLLYLAFAVLTGLTVRRLPDYTSALREAGFRRIKIRRFLGGLLVSEAWQLDARKVASTPNLQTHSNLALD